METFRISYLSPNFNSNSRKGKIKNFTTKNTQKKFNFPEFLNTNFDTIKKTKENLEAEEREKFNYEKLKKLEIFYDAKEKAKKNFIKKLPKENYFNNFYDDRNFDDVSFI